MRPITHEGARLLHNGILALAEVEATGMRIDTQRLDQNLEETEAKIKRIQSKLIAKDEWALWRKRFGASTKIGSHEQMGELLFEVMKFPCTEFTDNGRPSTDITALEKVDLPFVRGWLKMAQLQKAHGTYLKGIKAETVDGRLHPVFNLHTAITYRSSSDSPNFQNMPVRVPAIAKLIRDNFVPSEGCVLVETDYVGIEVRIAACYHKDPVMLTYIKDPTKDMHGDMAAQIYMLTEKWIKEHGKQHRYGAKNKFVFPEFYGDYYVSCAKALWEWMVRAKLEGPGGISLVDHLREHGITKRGACDPDLKARPGTFEKHIQEVENDFWNNRFGVYGKWKRKWWDRYQDTGGFDTLSGFRIEGELRRNAVINYPVQGSAFHCLLWSLIRINKLLKKRGMKSRIVGQIHDSIVADVRIEELADYLALVRKVMTQDIMRAYPWIIVPLDIENEICPPNGTWNDKCKVDEVDGGYAFKGKDGQTIKCEDTRTLIRTLQRTHSEQNERDN